MSDYILKEKVSEDVLDYLNESGYLSKNLAKAINDCYPTLKQVTDWIAAMESGEKIVNTMSPQGELRKDYFNTSETTYGNGFSRGIEVAVEVIAKEHPDVADWLDGETDE